MTFCIAIKVEGGLVALSDSRLTTGSEVATARKVSLHQQGQHQLFLMTSGLRSVRDKAVTYFEEHPHDSGSHLKKTYKAVNHLSEQLRKVAREDKDALRESGMVFDLNSIVGGQLEEDEEHKLYLLYPQANWVEVTPETPYQIIGESGYGKPLLDLVLNYDSSMVMAVKSAFLAFDATRRCSSNVDFPINVVFYRKDSNHMVLHEYEKEDLLNVSEWWQSRVRHSLDELPSDWIDDIFGKS